MQRLRRSGLTLVELLVVIAIIGLLVGLLLPAVQSARESSRRVFCHNNVRQIAIGMLQHEAQLRFFPTGGWGVAWMPEPDRGSDAKQPGGWGYTILPFIEQTPLWSLGAGGTAAAKSAANKIRCETVLPIWNCPTRRAPQRFTCQSWTWLLQSPYLTDKLSTTVRTDYAANAGATVFAGASPASLTQGDGPFLWPSASNWSGLVFQRSTIGAAHIRDGTTNTLLVGEKYVPADMYLTGLSPGDDQNPFMGYDQDVVRFTHTPPRQDTPSVDLIGVFGSAHPGGSAIATADGAVRTVTYEVASNVFRELGTRSGGEPVPTPE